MGDVSKKVSDVVLKVGDVSPKHHVGDSRLALVFGWKSDFKPLGNTNCRPNTGTSCLAATRPFGERSPTITSAIADSTLVLGEVKEKSILILE
ncbi:MAG: hypothetical protein LBI18_09275 [Planctomycetaceae bacterium]|nr:hypothetical protein [Planctomycetaceae bacterium]